MQRLAGTLAMSVWLIGTCCLGSAQADTLLDQTNVVGLPTNAAPSQHAFTDATAEALTVTLTDFQTPAAFSTLKIAVTLGDTLVGNATIDATHAASVALPAAAGNYTVYVVGTPDSVQQFGSFGVCVTRDADPTPRTCVPDYSYSDSLTTPSTPTSTGTSTLNSNFTTTAAGTYTITLSDDAFPAALPTLSAIITQGSSQVGGIVSAGSPVQLTLAAGTTYQILAAATADANLKAGLYGVHIVDPASAVVFDRSIPVGALQPATIVTNPSAQTLNLTVNDFDYPAPLAGLGAAVTSGGIALGTLNAAGTLPIATAPAGHLDVWTYSAAGAEPGVYSLSLSSTTASLLSTTQVVNPAATSGSMDFAFVLDLPAAATYGLAVNDFQFPAQLGALSATVAQNGVVLPQTSGGTFTAQAGNAIVLVNAQPPQNGNGIFGVTVSTTAATPQVLLDQTQAVGGVFNTQVVNVGKSGAYDVTLTDLAFPKAFQNLAVVLSSGSKVLGKIYGGGTFPVAISPGQYVFTFVASPDPVGYGLYSVNISSTAPTVSFTAASSSVSAGQTVQLTWSSQNATDCVAGGASAWTGSQPASGTLAVAIAATETLTLTCTGPGGSATQSVTITATAAAPSKSGGGGSADPLLLLVLALTASLRFAPTARCVSRNGQINRRLRVT
jgi:plastocyanin